MSSPVAEREDDGALNCWQDTDMQKWIFHKVNEVLDGGPPTTLTPPKASKSFKQYVHKIMWDFSLIYKGTIVNNN